MRPEAVVDSSVAVKWYVEEPDDDKAVRLLELTKARTIRLHAPGHLNSELGNIIWKKQVFHGLAAADADKIVGALPHLPIRIHDVRKLIVPAHRLAVDLRRTVYDCLYLALAAKLKCPFLTADERLVNAVRPRFPFVVLLRDWQAA